MDGINVFKSKHFQKRHWVSPVPPFGRFSCRIYYPASSESVLNMAVKRKTISKKTRFEVFKRDGFVCQYCGAHPPEAILEPDHINPVANGGGNEMDNLITACFSCNRGKAANLLTAIPKSLDDKAAELIERELQIKGYQSAMQKKKGRIKDESNIVLGVYQRFNEGFTLTESAMVSVRKFIDLIGFFPVLEAMEEANTRPSVRRGKEFQYFCGICWNIIKKGERHGAR